MGNFFEDAGGAILGGAINLIGQHSARQSQTAANNQNMWLNNENRAWQEMMSNTAHTREVSDLRNAGLNPILSATGGQGASTPSPSVADIDPVPAHNPMAALTSAMEMKTMAANLKKMGADTNLADKAAETEVAKTINANANTAKTVSDTGWSNMWNEVAKPVTSTAKTVVDGWSKIKDLVTSPMPNKTMHLESTKPFHTREKTKTPWNRSQP